MKKILATALLILTTATTYAVEDIAGIMLGDKFNNEGQYKKVGDLPENNINVYKSSFNRIFDTVYLYVDKTTNITEGLYFTKSYLMTPNNIGVVKQQVKDTLFQLNPVITKRFGEWQQNYGFTELMTTEQNMPWMNAFNTAQVMFREKSIDVAIIELTLNSNGFEHSNRYETKVDLGLKYQNRSLFDKNSAQAAKQAEGF